MSSSSFDPFGPISALISGGAQYLSAEATNRSNRGIARDQMRFQEKMTKEQMTWQRKMSDTAYQRSVADMKAAGLNPMLLAKGGGGASTPSGSAPSGAGIPMENELGPAVNSALSALRLTSELKNMAEQNRLLREQAAQAKSQSNLNNTTALKVAADAKSAESNTERNKAYGTLWSYANRAIGTGESTAKAFAVKPNPITDKIKDIYTRDYRGTYADRLFKQGR